MKVKRTTAPRRETNAPENLSMFHKFNLLYGGFNYCVKWTPEERRAAWLAHREKLLKEWIDNPDHCGWRPRGFWEFDFPGVLEKYADDRGFVNEEGELLALKEIGQLTPEEKDKLESGELYESAGSPCLDDRFFTGRPAGGFRWPCPAMWRDYIPLRPTAID